MDDSRSISHNDGALRSAMTRCISNEKARFNSDSVNSETCEIDADGSDGNLGTASIRAGRL